MKTSRHIVTRFAPSPSGLLHLGHAHSALFSWQAARRAGGRFILRIEDIDVTRCRPEFTEQLIEDLAWLGLEWDQPLRIQSQAMADYQKALNQLLEQELLYPCFCTRKDIQEEIARSGKAPHGPEGPLYPGLCKHLPEAERERLIAEGRPYALRLHMDEALRRTGPLSWIDRDKGEIPATPEILGDVVLARKDIATSYHLAVTLDDALQGVTLVTRGEDLFHATHVHRLLQALLDLPVPEWHHHGLIRDDSGQRLAKRHNALAIRQLREEGKKPEEVWRMAGIEG